jgi:hypothetical protein
MNLSALSLGDGLAVQAPNTLGGKPFCALPGKSIGLKTGVVTYNQLALGVALLDILSNRSRDKLYILKGKFVGDDIPPAGGPEFNLRHYEMITKPKTRSSRGFWSQGGARKN